MTMLVKSWVTALDEWTVYDHPMVIQQGFIWIPIELPNMGSNPTNQIQAEDMAEKSKLKTWRKMMVS